MVARFEDRHDAGRRLADAIRNMALEVDIVLAIPRGGLPLGREVADVLDRPLDIVVARKIGAPHNAELAIGAVGSDGSVWLNESLVTRLDVSDHYLDQAIEQETKNAQDKANRYRGERSPPALAGKRVLIVDDGIATGATMIACIRLVRDGGAAWVGVAVPVGPPDSVKDVEAVADRVVCLETPRKFGAVGQYYRRFHQVRDEEAMEYLST